MSVDLSSPLIHPTIGEDGEELDETAEIPDPSSTPSDILSERSRVWLARHGEDVHSRISSSKHRLAGVVHKKTLKDFEDEKATVFMKTTQQLSYDVLATEFISQNYTTIDTRIYLLDKLIPCLAFSLQRLLLQVLKLGVVEKDISVSGFNPINYLAQQLMRNNPRYNHSAESSPYGVGLRLAADEMKRRLFAMEESRLAKIKADAHDRRKERERQKQLKKQREAYRYSALERSYLDWLMVGLTTIPKSPIYSALTSFQERIADVQNISTEHYSFADREEFVDTRAVTDATDFASILMPSVKLVASDMFELFEDHLKGCASSYRLTLIREKRKDLLENIFTSIDDRLDGKLNRHRIVQLFTQFYEHANTTTQKHLIDPKTFGISEFEQDIICESQGNIQPQIHGDSDINIDKSQNGLIPVKSDNNLNISNGDVSDDVKSRENDTTKTELETNRIEQPQSTEQESDILKEQTTDPAGESGSTQQAGVPEEKPNSFPQRNEAAEQPGEGVGGDELSTVEGKEISKEENPEHINITDEAKNADSTINNVENIAESLGKETLEEPKGENPEISEGVHPAIVVEPSNTDIKELDPNTQPSKVQPSEDLQESPPLSTNNLLTCIQEIEEVDETVDTGDHSRVQEVENGVVSLDVTIAIDDGGDSQNTTQDLNDNKLELGVKSGSRLVSIKSAQILRNKALSRLANIDPESIRSFVNTPLNYKSPGIPWNVDFITIEQFTQLTEFYWGTHPNPELVEDILKFISGGYMETEFEKEERLREEWLRKLRTNQFRNLRTLFIKWDNDRAGHINKEDFTNIITSWPKTLEYTKLTKLPDLLKEFQFLNEDIVTREEFFNILSDSCLCLEEEHEFLEYLEFIERNIKLTQEQKQRGAIRSTWLDNIITVSRTCGLAFDPIFKTALGCIYRDNEHHGLGKKAKCNVGLLEFIQGQKVLHYVTASQDDHDGVVGKILKEEDKCVGFSVIKSGKMIHIPKILETKQPVHFFYPQRKSRDKERKGSFICCPLQHPRGHVIGVLGIDTLTEVEKKDFFSHEVSFYQGVAKTLGEAYSFVELRIKLVKILHSAFRWTLSKVHSISNITVYIVEDPPQAKVDEGYIIRKVLTMCQGDVNPVEDVNAPRIFRKDDVFKEYLFKCADNSEPTTTETFGHLHWTIPVRDIDGFPMGVIDIEVGEMELSKPDEENILWMARLVTIAVLELSQGYREPPMPHVLEAEGIDEENRLAVLFSRVLLTDLRYKVEKLDTEAYAEIKSYIDPPKVIHDVLKAVLYIFNPAKSEAYKQWRNCKQSINNDLTKSISIYDPTSERDVIQINELQQLLSIVPDGEVEKHGSLPTKYLHDWAMVCLSLLEHTKRMQDAFGAKMP